jgi:hypothetical protein
VVVTDSGSPRLSQFASFAVNVFDLGPAASVSRATIRTKNGYAIVLKFSQPLDPSTAIDPGNYILILARKSKKLLVPTPIPLLISYDPATNTVTLVASAPVKTKQALQLTVIGKGPHGIAKITGLPLAGKRGRPGTNYVARVMGKRIQRT